MENTMEHKYNSAKTWQLGFFTLNNTATNMFMFFMGFMQYFATGTLGLSLVFASFVITGSRIWDGITDPIIGLLIDRTNTKYGKFRPYMLLGHLIMAVVTFIMYFILPNFDGIIKSILFVILYLIFIIGYTFQTACTKSGQSAITNDPKQRPLFTLFDTIYNSVVFLGGQIYVTSVLIPKHGGFNGGLFKDLYVLCVGTALVFTILAIIGIWSKDNEKYFGVSGQAKAISFRDMIDVIAGNRQLQLLVVAASTDKLGYTVSRNAVVVVMLYGIVVGNYSLSGTVGLLTMIPSIIIMFFGIGIARKQGSKKALVSSTWLAMISAIALGAMFMFGDPTTISLKNLNLFTVVFLFFTTTMWAFGGIAGGIVIPMIADVTDYEVYNSGRYMPGTMGTLFSFVDKMVSSLGTALVGIVLAIIGYGVKPPTIDTPNSPQLFWAMMSLWLGILMFAWIASLIAMKYYKLDGEYMVKIQKEIADKKEKLMAENA